MRYSNNSQSVIEIVIMLVLVGLIVKLMKTLFVRG